MIPHNGSFRDIYVSIIVLFYVLLLRAVGLFLANAYLTVALTIPLEERMGELSLAANSDDKFLEQSSVVQSLFLHHLAVLGMFFLIGVQQTVSFDHGKERGKNAGGGGGGKSSKSSKKKKRN